jgi:hypothetical protein
VHGRERCLPTCHAGNHRFRGNTGLTGRRQRPGGPNGTMVPGQPAERRRTPARISAGAGPPPSSRSRRPSRAAGTGRPTGWPPQPARRSRARGEADAAPRECAWPKKRTRPRERRTQSSPTNARPGEPASRCRTHARAVLNRDLGRGPGPPNLRMIAQPQGEIDTRKALRSPRRSCRIDCPHATRPAPGRCAGSRPPPRCAGST